MGCDIHIYFETLDQGKWRPTFGCSPDPKWWWDGIADDKLENGAADLVIPNLPDESAGYSARHAVMKEYFQSIPADEIVARYGDNPKLNWTYNIPNDDTFAPNVMRISTRDYSFFRAVAKDHPRGNNPNAFPVLGVPDNVSPEVKAAVDRMDGDGHTHSWVNVQAMLEAPHMQEFEHHLKWLREHIKDPENTRMVFFFDN